MKKMVLGFTALMTMIAAVATFAEGVDNIRKGMNYPSVKTQLTTLGKGSCRHAACPCQKYESAHNGGKCVCGHWDYVHN